MYNTGTSKTSFFISVRFDFFAQGIISMSTPILVYVAGVNEERLGKQKMREGEGLRNISLTRPLLPSPPSLSLLLILRLLPRLINLGRLHRLLGRLGAKFLSYEPAHVLKDTRERGFSFSRGFVARSRDNQ